MEKLTLNSEQDLKNYKKILKKNYILFLLLGFFGIHRFYLEKDVSGFFQFVLAVYFSVFFIFFIFWILYCKFSFLFLTFDAPGIFITCMVIEWFLFYITIPLFVIYLVWFIFDKKLIKKAAKIATNKKFDSSFVVKNFYSCVIMCGGKSSRMGQDKTLMEFGEFRDLTHFQFAKMSEIFKSVFISAKSQKFDPPLPVLADEFDDFSPMGAIYSILKNFKDDKVFIIPCDMPFVEISTIYELYENVENYDICVASDEFRQHNLCGFFDTGITKKALNLYENNNHKIANLLNLVKFKAVKFANSEQFHNINDENDYKKALLLLQKDN